MSSLPLKLNNVVHVLADLVDWYEFGVFLEVPPSELKKIEARFSQEQLKRRKIELFEYWLKNDDSPSWVKILKAAEKLGKESNVLKSSLFDKVPELKDHDLTWNSVSSPNPFPPPPRTITITLQETLGNSLFEIQTKFGDMVYEISKSLEANNVPFEDVKRFTSEILNTTFQPEPESLYKLFGNLKSYYCFMSYRILELVIDKFIKKSMEACLKEYNTSLQEWLQSTTVREFQVAVEKAKQLKGEDEEGADGFATNVVPVVLKLEGKWMDVMIDNLRKLLKYIFRHKSSVLAHIEIKEGSVIVKLLAPGSEILPLISLASKRIDELGLIGVRSITIANINMRSSFQLRSSASFSFEISLNALIISFKYTSGAQFLLEMGVDANTLGPAVLIIALLNNNTTLMSSLLHYGADPNGVIHFDGKSGSVLQAAAVKGHVEAVELLLNHGADANLIQFIGGSPLSSAIHGGSERVVRLLLKHKANPNVAFMSSSDPSPLVMAVQFRHHSIVTALLEAGADADLQANSGPFGHHTALMMASHYGLSSITDELLKAKANVNIRSQRNETAIYLACQTGHTDIVQSLVNAGADPNICDINNLSPLHVACMEHNSPELIHALFSSKIPVNTNIKDKERHWTPLFYAAVKGNVEVVKLLLKNGANFKQEDKFGKTPQTLAGLAGNFEVVRCLDQAAVASRETEQIMTTKNVSTPVKEDTTTSSSAKEVTKDDVLSYLKKITSVVSSRIQDTYNQIKKQIENNYENLETMFKV